MRIVAGLSVVALTLILSFIFLGERSESNAPTGLDLIRPDSRLQVHVRDSGTPEYDVPAEVGERIAHSESDVRYIDEVRDVVAIAKWRESLGYLDSNRNTSSIAAAYQAYDNDTLESLSNLGDANAQLLLAERYSIVEEKQERLLELYYEAAIAGKTAALTALGTYGFTDKVFGKNDLVRVNEEGQLTDDYERYLAYFLAAEMQLDPVGAAFFDFNIDDAHKALIASRMEALCEKGRKIVQELEGSRKERGISIKMPEPPPGLLDDVSPNWHCGQAE